MTDIETKARTDFVAWCDADPARTWAAIGRALSVSSVSVWQWARGLCRPTEPLREALQVLTEDAVKASDWRLPDELELVASVRPFRAAG